MSATLVQERSSFISKVYSLFIASLVVAGIGASVGMSMNLEYRGSLSLVGLLLLFLAGAVRTIPGLNVGALFLFTFVEGLTFGPIFNIFQEAGRMDIVYQSLEITGGSFLALTLYVFIAKEDFNWLGAIVWPALIGMLITGLLNVFWPMGGTAFTVYLYLGVLLFIGFILYDTSRIVTRYPDDHYAAGAIDLFLDFINLFMFVLQLLGGRASRD
ncbi:MAG: Bax inhibitor-1/YccA family protein [Candidatus Wallbacteria bacterium]|nr:Bax inhibitor-1/YccA family protein [Candidatus Wallbacteria bacterium]